MTAETSNARGEWVLVPRNPTEAMIDAWRDAPDIWEDAYAAMLAAAPQPPSAPVGVEGLIEAAKAAESMLRTVHECASHECEDCREYAGIVAKQLRAALAQKPEARGVVDEGSRIVTSQLLHWGGIPVRVTGTVTTSPGNWSLIDAALTEARDVP